MYMSLKLEQARHKDIRNYSNSPWLDRITEGFFEVSTLD